MLLSQFFRHVYLVRRYLTEGTAANYWSALNKFNEWHGKGVLLSQLSASLMRRFLRDYSQHQENASANHKRRAILAIWRAAYRWGFKCEPPPEGRELPKLKEPQRTPRAWSMEEFSQILKACTVARTIQKDGKLWDARHWKGLLLTIYDTAERISALLQTRRSDLDHRGYLTIRGENRKNQTRDITRKLHSSTLEVIESFPPHYLLFPWPLAYRSIFIEFDPILHAAGLPVNRKNKFHCARRTSATWTAAELGLAAAQKHLDHSNPAITLHSYVDSRFMPEEDVSDRIQRPAG